MRLVFVQNDDHSSKASNQYLVPEQLHGHAKYLPRANIRPSSIQNPPKGFLLYPVCPPHEYYWFRLSHKNNHVNYDAEQMPLHALLYQPKAMIDQYQVKRFLKWLPSHFLGERIVSIKNDIFR